MFARSARGLYTNNKVLVRSSAALAAASPFAAMSSSSKPQLAPDPNDHGLPLEGKRAQLVHDCLDYNPDILERSWDKNATFADPIALAQGYDQYSAQWRGMPAAFEQSETLAWKVTKNEPGALEYEQRQLYTFKGLKNQKEMASLVVMKLNSEEKIIEFEDRWDAKPLPTGRISKALRDFQASYIVPTMVGKEKN